jgi:1,4-alpha-glucan branching enzyme
MNGMTGMDGKPLEENSLDAPISVYELHLGSWVRKVMIQTVFELS